MLNPRMNRKVISYVLWGNRPEYLIGAVKNSNSVEKIYPGWEAVFFIHKDVSSDIISEIEKKSKVIIFNDQPDHGACLLRYSLLADPSVKIFISRDCDSRLNDKEYRAVCEWEESNFQFHTMRDSIYHSSPPVLAGMCGFKNIGSIDPKWLWDNFTKFKSGNYGDDQRALNLFYLQASNLFLEHDDMLRHNSKKFPQHSSFQVGTFIGQKINEDDKSYDELGISVFWQNNEPIYVKKV
jgi:hypothetical protein